MYIIKKFKKKAVVTEAVIINKEKRQAYRSGVYYVFGLQYKIPETGDVFNARAVSAKNLNPGDTMPLMYSADDPAKYKTDFGKRLPLILGFSIIFLGLLIWFCYWLLNSNYYEPSPLQ